MKQLGIKGESRPDKNLLHLLLLDGFDTDEIAGAFPITEKQIYEAFKQWEFEPKELKKLLSDVRKALKLTEGEYTGFKCSPSDPVTKSEIDYNKATTRTKSTMKMWYFDFFLMEKIQDTDHKRAVLNCKIDKKLDSIGLYLVHYYVEMIRAKLNYEDKRVINSLGKTCEDVLHDLFLECYNSNEIKTLSSLLYQIRLAAQK